MEEKLTLNDGTELERSSALLSGDLFLYVQDGETDLRRLFELLIEPENTQVITYTRNNGDEVEYTGYTKLIAVRDEGNGLVTAVLRREVVD